MNGRILVTGASGFVGKALCSIFLAKRLTVRAAVRSVDLMLSLDGLDYVAVGEVNGQTDWSSALEGVDCIIHCAARAHVMQETGAYPLVDYRSVNVEGAQRLAEQAAALRVRLVFLSSIKVNGDETLLGAPFMVSQTPAPEDLYGISKWEAEQALWKVAAQRGLEVVVVRLPLVFGPGVKGNLLRLLRWVSLGMPLPLGAVHNQRSMIGLVNLGELLLLCAEHPDAAGQTFLASDSQDLSTPELIQLMAEGMNRHARLLRVPVSVLKLGSSMLGKRGEIDRLTGSLQVDSGYTKAQLGWAPLVSVEDGVREMARCYASTRATLEL
jgi:nucleoside-diphosphate-sugar epimerase